MRYLWLLFCVFAFVALGCGGADAPTTAKVTGRITLDEKPLENGLIQFTATDGIRPPAAAEIRTGEYSVDVPFGDMRVQISSGRVVGKRKMYDTPDSPEVDITEERIPLQYNAQSELKADVSAAKTRFDFAIKSQP